MKNSKKVYLVAAVLLLAVVISGVSAYLNDSETQQDRITLSDSLKIELSEPAFDGQALKNVRPRQVIPKDPRVVNHSSFDVYAYLEVVLPYFEDLVVQDALGKVVEGPGTGSVLYTYQAKAGWSLVRKPLGVALPNGEKGVSYVYAWMRGGQLTPVKPNEATGPLFEQVTVVNYTNAYVSEGSRDITVNAYGIDAAIAADTEPGTPKSPAAIWTLLKNTYPSPTPTVTPTPMPTASASPAPTGGMSPDPSPTSGQGADGEAPVDGDGAEDEENPFA